MGTMINTKKFFDSHKRIPLTRSATKLLVSLGLMITLARAMHEEKEGYKPDQRSLLTTMLNCPEYSQWHVLKWSEVMEIADEVWNDTALRAVTTDDLTAEKVLPEFHQVFTEIMKNYDVYSSKAKGSGWGRKKVGIHYMNKDEVEETAKLVWAEASLADKKVEPRDRDGKIFQAFQRALAAMPKIGCNVSKRLALCLTRRKSSSAS